MLVENTDARIYHLPTGNRLMPGVNDVSPEDWEKSENHPVIAYLVTTGVLKTMGKSAKVSAPVVDTLAGFSSTEAEMLVAKTFDRELLTKWALVEKRAKVKKLIEMQIGEMTAKPTKED